jgi:tetratricopeptide (TPR) repeat protein
MTDMQDSRELVQKGQAAARVGRWEEARRHLRRAVELDPKDVEAWLALAGAEDGAEAKATCFEKALALDPHNVEARLGLDMLQARRIDAVPGERGAEDEELERVLAEASRRLEDAVGPAPTDEVPPDDEVLYCANHPNVETMLRCNRCGKPICTRCAVRTPVGYRCKQCVGQQQAVFYTGGVSDYVIGGGIALVLGGIASFLMSLLVSWFFALILGPTVGIGISEAVRLVVRRRRSRYLWLAAGGGILVGSLPALFLALLGFNLWSLLSLGIFLVLATGAAVARLR